MIDKSRPVIVVGAGVGGLSAAIHLATAGHPVIVVEQNPSVGGKMGRVQIDGFTWDTGPSVITMRSVLDELFEQAGRRLTDYLSLVPVEPLTRYFYPDGTTMDATRDLPTMIAQIAERDPRDVEGYLGFLAHTAALDRITSPVFIRGDPPTLGAILKVPMRDMVQVDAWRSMDAAIRHWVRHPHLRNMLRRYATYVGASPYRAPAVLNVIAHQELTAGIWYAEGGIYTIAQAYRQLAEELGVEIRTSQRVTEILVDEAGRARGVALADGSRILARAVVANVDVTTAYQDLLPRRMVTRRLRRLVRVEPSLSGFVLLIGVRRRSSQLVQHNIIFSHNYRQEFEDIFSRGVPPACPTIYISISSKHDPHHAPQGCENWFVLVNVPPLSSAFDWAADGDAYRDLVLDRMAEVGLDIRADVVTLRTLTPVDLQVKTGAWRGSLYGLSSNKPLNALRRPPPRDPRIRGLYFAGGSTHPGGGVPMVTLSGGVASRMLEEDLADRRLEG
ncbi:MAG: phytoene desaturase family protein [Anaerolineae bacterium]